MKAVSSVWFPTFRPLADCCLLDDGWKKWREPDAKKNMTIKKQKWLMLCIVLVLVASTAGALTRLKSNVRLGKPGIKAAPIPGSMVMKIELPENVLDFTSSNVPTSQVVLDYLPKDTSYAQRYYTSPDGFRATANIILMGADRTSIHRPEYCLPGQGWQIETKTEVKIPIKSSRDYELPVMKWVISNTYQTPDGQKHDIKGLYVFWFVADNKQSTGIVPMQLSMIQNQLLTGVLQRWAYISYFAICAPGQEDAAFERMKNLIANSVPAYQLLPTE